MNYALIITGPTGSGKTDLSLSIADKINCEIINADVGQFYTPLNIGTAKPDFEMLAKQHPKTPHHLFNILNKPEDFTVVEFRKKVIELVNEIHSRNRLPIIVGGSLFYIKSLFYPPVEYEKKEIKELLGLTTKQLWELLCTVDAQRSKQLHKNDVYRIRRALEIYYTTGKTATEAAPQFSPPFHSRIIFLDLDKQILFKKIEERTQIMLQSGWVEEVEKLIDTELNGRSWENFIKQKGFIGYPEIIEFIKNQKQDMVPLMEQIILRTKQYVKKQTKFWNSFSSALTKNSIHSRLHEVMQVHLQISTYKFADAKSTIKSVESDLQIAK